VIECIFNIGASFYTTCEQRKWYRHESRRSETSKNKTYPNTGEWHGAEMDMEYKHRQQHWQSGHGKYIHLYNSSNLELRLNSFFKNSRHGLISRSIVRPCLHLTLMRIWNSSMRALWPSYSKIFYWGSLVTSITSLFSFSAYNWLTSAAANQKWWKNLSRRWFQNREFEIFLLFCILCWTI
jgi:hypothetical protein